MTAKMKSGTVEVSGVNYQWNVYRQPRWTGDGTLLGLAILVKPVKSSRRELVLEFTIDRSRPGDMAQHENAQISKRRIIECIQNALDAGWDPESRGKEFFYSAGSINSG